MVDEGAGSRDASDGVEDAGLVEVMFAKSLSEAVGCRSLLQEQNIPARVEDDSAAGRRCGIAILVPSDRLIEASELLATRVQDDGQPEDDGDGDENVAELEDDGDDEDYDDDYEDQEEDEGEDDSDLDKDEEGI
jgi:hypothetical protein